MSFLTYQPDLSDTLFANQSQNIQIIRDFLVAEIKQVAPDWLDNPKGILGELWKKDEVYATCYWLWIANMLHDMYGKINQESLSRLQSKFKALLYASEPNFSEYRAEFEVGWYLSSYTDSFVIEPLASRDGNINLADQTHSPDFAFDLEDITYLEVTTFYVGILDKWQKTVDYITSSLQNRLSKKGRQLKIYLQLPLKIFEPKQLKNFDANQVIQHIWRNMHTDRDELTIAPNGKIQWEPYRVSATQAHIPLEPQELDDGTNLIPFDGTWQAHININSSQSDSTGFIQITPFGVYHSPNIGIDKASFVKESSIVTLSESDVREANELVLKSLIKKLHVDKREQFPLRRQKPYILAIKPGNYHLQGDGLFKLIEQFIWSDDKFDWISGIILFTSRSGFLKTDVDNEYTFFPNPNSVCPIDASFKDFFRLKKRGYRPSNNLIDGNL